MWREEPQLLSRTALFTDQWGLGAIPESQHPHAQLSRAHTLGLTAPLGSLPATPPPKRPLGFEEGMPSLLFVQRGSRLEKGCDPPEPLQAEQAGVHVHRVH